MGKIFTVTMPDIGEGVVEGEVIEWLKQPNDLLLQDEPVVVVMTDKATVELPAPYPGKLAKQYYKPGQMAKKDLPLYDIETASTEEIAPPLPPQTAKPTPQSPKPPPISTSSHKTLSTPPVRKLAKDLGIDINQMTGSGPEGRVTESDLLSPTSTSSADHTEPLIGIRALMAKRMAESKANIPHFSYFEQFDATRLVQLRHSFKETASTQNISVTFMPFIIKALSLCITKYPIINSSLTSDKSSILYHHAHNIGIAITTPKGLIVPVLKNVQVMNLQTLILAYEDLKQKATSNSLQNSDMKDGTITISNFGVLGGGGLWATPIINFPEVAILGVGRIHKELTIRNNEVTPRDVLNLSWSFDHRIIDGDLASAVSHYLCGLLQNPASLL
ncbi:MAG: 2-oxo acid dehydrogenase subunit E2 [Parachlamydiaceae bacterium]|nr:2-oxo acid dehydrogenase subunit E2 [Parachlamydiaceae bacterium]